MHVNGRSLLTVISKSLESSKGIQKLGRTGRQVHSGMIEPYPLIIEMMNERPPIHVVHYHRLIAAFVEFGIFL